MSLELRKVILSRAEEEAKNIISSAEHEAKKIIEEAYKLKQQEISREKERIAKDIGYEARLAEARLKARMIIAEAKDEVLKSIESSVWSHLGNLSLHQRGQSLLVLMKDAIKALLEDLGRGNKVIAYVSKKDLDIAKEIVRTISEELGIEVDVRGADISGGVIVSSSDGNIVIDNSYESRLKKTIAMFLSEIKKEVFS